MQAGYAQTVTRSPDYLCGRRLGIGPVSGQAEFMGTVKMDGRRDQVRAENQWFIRHAAVLARWPVLSEPWAVRMDKRIQEENAPKDIAYLHGAGR